MTSSIIRRPFRYSYHSAVLWLIAANVLVFAAGLVMPDIPYYFALNPASLIHGAFWQPVTYMFAHAGLSHLLFNMLGLFFFGTAVERSVGTKEFLLYYFLIGVLAGLFSFVTYIFTGGMGVFLLGASGAIFGLLLAYATIFPDSRIFVWGILPVKAPILVLVYAGIELFSELTSYNASVAHLTHLAGFGIGWLYFLARFGVNPGRRFFPRR
ncbi:MAG TPA: rhomboid family intramembrane serine protease [Rectinemataceae bacterium]|nr:rhomboid family intramembrane serine protease [Rectinemataceae bacterium]